MGNSNSTGFNSNTNTNPKEQTFGQILDYIATHYIFTMNFDSLYRLNEKTYCDKLVVLTAKIIEQYFTPLEITYLAQRVKNGQEVNELGTDKVVFLEKDDINKLDLQNPINKKRVCIGIGKFYIKIAHIFAAILMTINPVYVYKDEAGQLIKVPLRDKGSIPPRVPRELYKFNICDNRLHSLKRGMQNNEKGEKGENELSIHPNMCGIHKKSNNKGGPKTLLEEPGIAELAELYKDDNYDYTTGHFLGMSEETKKDFEEDLRLFYNIFTGNNVDRLPDHIKSFGDIQLKDYLNHPNCQGPNPAFNQTIKGSLSKKLIADYAKNIKTMIQNVNSNQELLLNVINQLFVYSLHPQTGKKEIRISPQVNETNIDKIVLETRAVIMKLYLSCEQDYMNGIKIYEALVEEKILETAQNQIKNLTKMSDKLSNDEM